MRNNLCQLSASYVGIIFIFFFQTRKSYLIFLVTALEIKAGPWAQLIERQQEYYPPPVPAYWCPNISPSSALEEAWMVELPLAKVPRC